jgi:hypothetical protein
MHHHSSVGRITTEVNPTCIGRHHQNLLLFSLLALATHRQSRLATCAYDGVVTSSSIATGRETIIRIKHPATSRPITFPPRHSSISHLKSPKCLAGRSSSLRIQITSSEEILRGRECNQQGQQLFSSDRDDARHVCRARTILQSTVRLTNNCYPMNTRQANCHDAATQFTIHSKKAQSLHDFEANTH